MSHPQFRKKPPAPRHMVRFWTTPELYDAFRKECDKHELQYGFAFEDFMRWFVEAKDKVIR